MIKILIVDENHQTNIKTREWKEKWSDESFKAVYAADPKAEQMQYVESGEMREEEITLLSMRVDELDITKVIHAILEHGKVVT